MAEEAALDRLVQVRRVLAWIVIGQVVVLAVTGAYLVFGYRPAPSQAWGPLTAEGSDGRTLAQLVRTAHRWAAWSIVLPALVLAAVAFADAMAHWRGPARRRSGAVTGPVVVALAAAGLLSGVLLPWDQLALWAVTVGANFDGYRWLLDDQVRFVLVGGSEVSVATMRRVFAIHVLLIPSLLAVALAITVRRRRSVD